MQNQSKSLSTVITITTLVAILFSGWVIFSSNIVVAETRGKCTNDCPDGKTVSCEGSKLETIDDPKNPGCICDGEEFRCNDKKKDKGKKNEKKKNSNTNITNTSNTKLN